MKKYIDKIKAFFESRPILNVIATYFLLVFFGTICLLAVVFGLLWITGIYSSLETALDLKFNSPVILVPMWTLLALSLLCAVIGCLMYFHRYKRRKSKSAFYNELAPVLDTKTKKVAKK